MGAIAIQLARRGSPDPAVVHRMLEAAPHRGSRCSVEVVGRVALGTSNDTDWITASLALDGSRGAVLCGALDNGADVRAQLRKDGAREPTAATPAATLLAAFVRWGDQAVAHLRGNFAGCVTDGTRLWCFRDQFGARPLFYHDAPDVFLAATEVKQVLAGGSLSREPDLEYLEAMLFFGGLGLRTAFRGTERVPRAEILSAGAESGTSSRRYWSPFDLVETADLDLDEAVEGTRALLERAVGRVLTGRDAILLSGGLDSPALAAVAARNGNGGPSLQSLTAIYPEHPSADERTWTRMAAGHLTLPLHEYVAAAGSLDDVDRWVRILDGPADVVSVPESAEAYAAARALGARTVINGEIAEMLFETRAYLLDHLLGHARLRAAATHLARLRSAGRTHRHVVRLVVHALIAPRVLTSWVRGRGRPPRGLPAWVEDRKFFGPSSRPLWRLDPRQRWKRMQTAAFRGEGIAFETDEICAATQGVESRRPFADVDLWEFVLSLPAEVKFPGRRTKPLLRRAMRGLLPDALIDRRDKTYFDEFHLAKADYPTLRRLLVGSPHRLDGFDYELLEERLERANMKVFELQWARNVARVHAFLDQWS